MDRRVKLDQTLLDSIEKTAFVPDPNLMTGGGVPPPLPPPVPGAGAASLPVAAPPPPPGAAMLPPAQAAPPPVPIGPPMPGPEMMMGGAPPPMMMGPPPGMEGGAPSPEGGPPPEGEGGGGGEGEGAGTPVQLNLEDLYMVMSDMMAASGQNAAAPDPSGVTLEAVAAELASTRDLVMQLMDGLGIKPSEASPAGGAPAGPADLPIGEVMTDPAAEAAGVKMAADMTGSGVRARYIARVNARRRQRGEAV